MNDDKKEKLKEYLRNNKPKRNLNSNNDNSKFDDKHKNSNNINSKSEVNSVNLKDEISDTKQIGQNFNYENSYNDNPIVIEDMTPYARAISIKWTIVLLALLFISPFAIWDRKIFVVFTSFISFGALLKDKSFNTFVYFYNDKIVHKIKSKITVSIDTQDISYIAKTIDATIFHKDSPYTSSKTLNIMALIFAILLILMVFFSYPALMTLIIILVVIVLLYPQIIVHKKLGGKEDVFYDVLFIKDKNGNILNFMIGNELEYQELKRYFLYKRNIDLDNVQKRFSALF